jgi:hypothetical protein
MLKVLVTDLSIGSVFPESHSVNYDVVRRHQGD